MGLKVLGSPKVATTSRPPGVPGAQNSLARGGAFCHVSRSNCDVVILFQAPAAHDSAPAGRLIADVPAHGPGAGRLLHRALAKPADLAGDHRQSQGQVPPWPAVVCPILLLAQKYFARRLRLLDGL